MTRTFCGYYGETAHITRRRLSLTFGVALFCVAVFVFGFASNPHLKRTAPGAVRRQYLLQKGDAPPAVRAGVLAALREFQEGYVRRDARELDSFMHRLFPESEDVLLLGTNGGEWIRGFRAVRELIRSDWQYWGDFRFAVEDSIVWGSGDVAWIASVGTVHDSKSDRPVRFSAILTRNGDRWLFRQLHFQWDERDPSPYDLLQPNTHARLARLFLQYLSTAWVRP